MNKRRLVTILFLLWALVHGRNFWQVKEPPSMVYEFIQKQIRMERLIQ